MPKKGKRRTSQKLENNFFLKGRTEKRYNNLNQLQILVWCRALGGSENLRGQVNKLKKSQSFLPCQCIKINPIINYHSTYIVLLFYWSPFESELIFTPWHVKKWCLNFKFGPSLNIDLILHKRGEAWFLLIRV